MKTTGVHVVLQAGGVGKERRAATVVQDESTRNEDRVCVDVQLWRKSMM